MPRKPTPIRPTITVVEYFEPDLDRQAEVVAYILSIPTDDPPVGDDVDITEVLHSADHDAED